MREVSAWHWPWHCAGPYAGVLRRLHNTDARRPAALGKSAGDLSYGIEPRTLFVGKGISVSGDINSCDRLVIDGSVQANLQDCKHMIVSESGLFDGNALIDDAEVHGRFEGELTVRNRLDIRATGHVSGTVSYRQIEIEAGGRISGSIQAGRM